MIKLSTRLGAISSLIPINSRVMDVGCDHALLDIYLYQKCISNKIIASDINLNALENAKNNVLKYHLEEIIEVRLSNGIDNLSERDNINTLVIAGMGTHTIIGILKNNLKKLKYIDNLIISSNTNLFLLRKEITALGYYIDDELIVEDNKKHYIIIRFIKGKKKYSKKELYFGISLLKKRDILFLKYYGNELAKLKLLLKMLPHNKDYYRIKKEIKLYQGIIE